MKTRPTPSWRARAALFLLPALIGISFAPTVTAQTAPGSISGRVSQTETGASLQGATVDLIELNRQVTTERDGGFSFPGVPAGSYTLRVRYTGLDPQNQAVAVASGERAVVEFRLTSTVYQLSEFVVAGEREGSAAAITLQRQAPNVKTVLSSDAFGSIARQNIGNFLQRVPGIVGVQGEVDITEVRVRGLAPSLSAVNIDGTRTPTAITNGSTRSTRIDALQAPFIQTIEVIKALTPDLDADSAGGTINMITKSALDYAENRLFGYSAAFTYDATFETDPTLAANVYYSGVYGKDRNFGVFLTANYDEVETVRSTTVQDYEAPWDFSSPFYAYLTRTGHDIHNQIRSGLSARMDYEWAEGHRINATISYTDYDDDMRRNRSVWPDIQRRFVVSVDPQGRGLDAQGRTANIQPGSDQFVTNIVGVQYRSEREIRFRNIENWSFVLGGTDRWDAYDLSYQLSLATSDGTEARDRSGSTTVDRYNYTVDRRGDFTFPQMIQTSGPDIRQSNLANSTITAEERKHFASDEIRGARIDLRRDFAGKWPVYLKTGLRIRDQEASRDDNNQFWNYSLRNAERFQDLGWNIRPADGAYSVYPQISVPLVFQDIRQGNPNLWIRNDNQSIERTLRDDVTLNERVTAGYLLGNVDIAKLSILGGVRYELTEVEGNAPLRNPRAPTMAQQYAQRVTVSGDYDDIFPSLHFRYRLTEGLQFRASYSTGIGRPDFGNIIPRTTIDELNETISQNNPGLLPQHVDNIDLTAEYYFEPAGVVSVGLFRKDISDFILPVTRTVGTGTDNGFGGDYAGYRLSTQTNGGTAEISGIEVAYAQQFTFLPGWLKGFGMFANYTYLKTEGDFGGTAVRRTGEIPGFVPRTGNAGVSYALGRFSARVQVNYVSDFITGFNATTPSQNLYFDERYVIDLNTRFSVKPWLNFFVDVANAGESHKDMYMGSIRGDRRREIQMQGATVTCGFSGRF